MGRNMFQVFLGFLFVHCEPALDGFERIVAAPASMKNSDVELFFERPFRLWLETVHPALNDEAYVIMTRRLWAAVGKWRDADLCFEALRAATNLVYEQLDDTEYVRRARRLTANWENKSNAQRVIDAFQKLTDDIEEDAWEQYDAWERYDEEQYLYEEDAWEDDESGDESPPTD